VILEGTTERIEQALRRLADDAGALFEELLVTGAELPFEIEPSDEGPLPMYQYSPLTGEFIRSHAAELRRLESFLEVRELTDEETAIGFLIGLWEGSSEFDVAEDRLRGAMGGVLASLPSPGSATQAGEVIVPLIGFHMPAEEIRLDGVRVVRAESIEDAPAEAIESTRPGKAARPGFLAVVSCGVALVAPAAAVADDLRRALRTMRLFKAGAVGIGPHGWSRRQGGWERFGTGAPRVRQGGYRLTGSEARELEAFARKLIERDARLPAFAWAVARFDLGAERPSLIEALSDYLLVLRGLLEGGGPLRASLSARAGALAEEPERREAARICVEKALRLERKLMSGGRFHPAADSSPLEAIAGLEGLLRRLLKGMATGELGVDLRAMADEVLIADGLRAGAGTAPAVGETAEWRIPEPGDPEEIEIRRTGPPEEVEAPESPGEQPEWQEDSAKSDIEEETEPTTRMFAPGAEVHSAMAVDRDDRHSIPGGGLGKRGAEDGSIENGGGDWFSAADDDLEWPAFASPRRDRTGRRGAASERVRYLFPVPDATDWEVGELAYQRRRR
jgi:hypothetical protein